MKYFLTILVFFYFASEYLAQDAPQVQSDPVTECIVAFIDDVKKAEASDDDKLNEGVEIGRFFPRFGGEGTFTLKRFCVGKLNLFVFASVNYEDDLLVDGSLTDAMTMTLRVTRSTNQNPKSWLAIGEMQIEYREDFNAANLDVLVNRKVKYSGMRMSCQRKK